MFEFLPDTWYVNRYHSYLFTKITENGNIDIDGHCASYKRGVNTNDWHKGISKLACEGKLRDIVAIASGPNKGNIGKIVVITNDHSIYVETKQLKLLFVNRIDIVHIFFEKFDEQIQNKTNNPISKNATLLEAEHELPKHNWACPIFLNWETFQFVVVNLHGKNQEEQNKAFDKFKNDNWELVGKSEKPVSEMQEFQPAVFKREIRM